MEYEFEENIYACLAKFLPVSREEFNKIPDAVYADHRFDRLAAGLYRVTQKVREAIGLFLPLAASGSGGGSRSTSRSPGRLSGVIAAEQSQKPVSADENNQPSRKTTGTLDIESEGGDWLGEYTAPFEEERQAALEPGGGIIAENEEGVGEVEGLRDEYSYPDEMEELEELEKLEGKTQVRTKPNPFLDDLDDL